MAEKKKAIHTGHRGRVKTEFLARGVEGWPDHRVLELLLFYAIPQGDTNPLAHELIDRFGSLSGVLDAMPEDLMKVKGMGEHSAVLLKLLPAVMGRYLHGRAEPGQTIQNVEQAAQAFAPYLYGANNEVSYLMCLDVKEKLLGIRRLSEGNLHNTEVPIRRAAEVCMALQATFCYLAHNHPQNLALPSPEDMNTTNVIRTALAPLGVQLLDHLIFSNGELVSVRQTAAMGRTGGYRLVHFR